jgi:Flp pilus assembly protein TadG
MRRLSTRLRPSRERGAVAILVTILLSFGVVFGSLAISADVGRIMSERRELQNGADAASMALAQYCAAADAACTTAGAPTAIKPLANANAKDQKAAISSVCAGGVPGIAAACEAGVASNLGKCTPRPTWLAAGVPYVEVKTKTETASGGSVLGTPFARALSGGSPGTTVTSCARAAWGPPGAYTATVPVVISACEWKRSTTNGTVYQAAPKGAAPGYGTPPAQTAWPPSSAEITIFLKTTTSVPCAINGKDTAGGFGYVLDSAGNCQASLSINSWAQINTGSSTPCEPTLSTLRGTVIDLPVFDCLIKSGTVPAGGISGYPDCTGATGGGANSYYHVVGWAKFFLSGYKVGGSQEKPSYLTGNVPCTGGNRCLSGWYVAGPLSGATSIVPGGSSFGAYAVLPAG